MEWNCSVRRCLPELAFRLGRVGVDEAPDVVDVTLSHVTWCALPVAWQRSVQSVNVDRFARCSPQAVAYESELALVDQLVERDLVGSFVDFGVGDMVCPLDVHHDTVCAGGKAV